MLNNKDVFMDKPLVSVVMPAYNCEKFVVESINSVINQSYKNWEMIIVDDFSTDNTNLIISNFIKDYDNIFLFENEKNAGVGQTRNNAISHAKGEYIAFLDSDDIWLKNKLTSQISLLDEKNGDMCYSSYSFIDENSDKIDNIYNVPVFTTYENLLKENVIGTSTAVVKKELLGENPFSSDFFHEDFVLWLQVLKKINVAHGIKKVLALYRTGGRSSNKLKAAKNRWLILRKNEKLSFFKTIKYMIIYAINGVKKHYK